MVKANYVIHLIRLGFYFYDSGFLRGIDLNLMVKANYVIDLIRLGSISMIQVSYETLI